MRHQGQARAGYFPCHEQVVSRAARHLRCRAPAEATGLDPCCGEGRALAQLVDALAIPRDRTYGIELDDVRSDNAREVLAGGHILSGTSFHQSGITPGSFSLCWLNPPYDDEVGGGRREELGFLIQATRTLKPGGILCFVIPSGQSRDQSLGGHLDSWYDNLRGFLFPEERRQYGEVLVLARKRRHPIDPSKLPFGEGMQSLRHQLHYWPILGTTEDRWDVPPGDKPRRFLKTGYAEPELTRILDQSPLAAAVFGDPREPKIRQPGLPVRHGQMVLTLVAGRLDGVVRRDGSPPHIVRATCKKRTFLKEEQDLENKDGDVTGHKKVYAEEPITTLRVIPHDFGAIHSFASTAEGGRS